ncbi:MAG: hypothetical protein D3917_19235, partial [Candidatus Electrothrix sp. AX5]|nr:hypothetical protein [Candidatus Electrothrix sp. AX5]
ILTGQLGDVMKESAQAALTYCRSRSKALGVSDQYFDTIDIHVAEAVQYRRQQFDVG